MMVVAGVTLREIRRRRLLWVVVVLGVGYLAMFGSGVVLVQREMVQGNEAYLARHAVMSMLLAAGLYVIQFLVLVFAAIVSVDTIAGEVASGAIQAVVTKPIRRRDVMLGKFMGHVAAVVAFAVAMSLGAVAIVAAVAGSVPVALLGPLALVSLEGVVVLAVSYLGGTVMGTLANALIVFMLYAVALVGSWIERIGNLMGNAAAQYLGVFASLVMPTEALWQRAAWLLLPPVLRETVGVATPFTSANPPSGLMVAYGIAYAIAATVGAILAFEHRDL